VLESGNAEFGFPCFGTGVTTQPPDGAETVGISASLDGTYDGESAVTDPGGCLPGGSG
jgi:hypothetical protein